MAQTIYVRDLTQLKNLIEKDVEKAIKGTVDEVMKLLKKSINENVYDDNNSWYLDGTGIPSYEFRDLAWVMAPIRKTIREIVGKIYYDGKRMDADEATWKHYSKIGDWGDSREYLADILNKSGWTSSLHWKKTAPYWDKLINLLDNGEFDKIFRREFKKLGIDVV